MRIDYEDKFKELYNAIDKIKETTDDITDTIYRESFSNGYNAGFNKGFEVGSSNLSIDYLDWNSIKIFAAFCYINGIDFSYMAKPTDTVPFVDRVVNKFKDSIEKEDISTDSYRKYIKSLD